MNLIPGTTHVVTWSKQNLLDDATYYVRAVIRDTRSGVTLATFDLTNVGSGRYSYAWNVAADPTGRGREVEVEKTIYEDADYTVVSAMYGRWLDQYLIYDPRNPSSGGSSGSGGAGSIDYGVIAQIFSRIIKELPPPKPVDLSEIVGELDGVKKTLGDRLREILHIGNKANKIEQLETRVKATLADLLDAITEAKKLFPKMQDANESAVKRIDAAATKASERIAEAADLSEESLTEKVDEQLTYAVEQFGKVFNAEGKKLTDTVTERITEELAKPLTVQTVQTAQVVRDSGKKKGEPDSEEQDDNRVNRLLTYGKK